ncbi:MAG: hypothetical protein AB4290_12550 [Spirulina sp.]
MESLAYTYSVLAWEEETPELRNVNWWGATSALTVVASVHTGVAYGNEIHVPPSLDAPDYSHLVSENWDADDSYSKWEEMASPEIFASEISPEQPTRSHFGEPAAIASEIAPPETISPSFSLDKQAKSHPTQTQKQSDREKIEVANKSYGYYPRPYYSRTKIPEELKISPFSLVHRAYHGGFRDSGIPGYSTLIHAAKSGKVDATDLIRAGIIQGRLTTQDLYDPGYLSAVRAHLKDMGI